MKIILYESRYFTFVATTTSVNKEVRLHRIQAVCNYRVSLSSSTAITYILTRKDLFAM